MKWAYVFIRHFPYLAEGVILTVTGKSLLGRAWHQEQCRDWIIFQFAVNAVLTFVVETVLIVRIYAIYNRNKALAAVLLLLFYRRSLGRAYNSGPQCDSPAAL